MGKLSREPLRIGFNANPILGNRGGIGWHTYHLLRALLELKDDIQFVCYLRPGAFRDAEDAREISRWESSLRIRWVEAGKAMLPWRGAWDRLDLYHGTNFKMQTTGRYGGIVTIHDLWLDRHPEYSPKFFGQRASYYRTKRTAWRARKVITVSQYSAGEIQSLYKLPSERIVVIPNGVSDDFQPVSNRAALADLHRRLALPTDSFILFVGGANPRKNHGALLRAYASHSDRLKDHSLVMVGEPVNRFGDMMATTRTLGLEHRVVCTGTLSVTDLRLLYSQAAVFVFPSLYEGFGMPVLEAMACGAPVITSNTTALPEVAGDAAVLVNPEDAEELADAIFRVLEDSVLRARLKERGFERAKQFTWERAAQRTVAVYREICR